MRRTLPLPLIALPSQALPREVPLEPLPSTSRLSPAELAQVYRTWWFGPGRAASCNHLIGRGKR
jgi:hypothetical protein